MARVCEVCGRRAEQIDDEKGSTTYDICSNCVKERETQANSNLSTPE